MNEKIKVKKARVKERELLLRIMHLSAEHKICKIIFTPTRHFSSSSVFTPSLLFISVSSMFKMKTTKKYSKRLAHQNNPHAEIIETNRRKTSNQTDPHKIFKILNTQMHPISSMTGFFDLKFCNLIHNSEYISLCILDFCTAVVLKENCCTVKVIALFLHILWYASTYACTHAFILHILTRTPRRRTRFHTLHMLNTEKLTHVHNQGLEICLGQPHNDIWHVCGGDMRVWWRLWNRAGGFWLHLSCFVFFHKLCIILRAETSCKHSGTLITPTKTAQDQRRKSNGMFEA